MFDPDETLGKLRVQDSRFLHGNAAPTTADGSERPTYSDQGRGKRTFSNLIAISAILAILGSSIIHAGTLDVVPGASYVGDYGLEVIVSDPVPAYVQDDSPFDEVRYRARFYVRLTSLSMSAADEFDLFSGYAVDTTPVLRLTVSHDGADRRLLFTTRLDDGSYTTLTSGIVLADGWRAVEIDWKASSAPGADDGRLDLWVDGELQAGLSDLDNDALNIDYVRWGAIDSLDAGTSGSFLLDTFESRRAGYIGLDPVFSDVPGDHIFQDYILGLYNSGVTRGCGGDMFCPYWLATRGQMAVFVLKAHLGADYRPPACTSPSFGDVPCSFLFASWIEDAHARGIISGCGGGNYCPYESTTRGTMAPFMLRAVEGAGYTPPPCTTPTFSDVPCSHPLADWIEEIYARGITAGCGDGNFCPDLSITRGQMAVFLLKAFSLPVPTF